MKAQTLERRFSLERVALLLRNRIYDEAPAIGIVAAIVLANNLLSLWAAHQAMFNAPSLHGSAWIATIVIGGLLIAGNAFKGMHDGKAGSEWILLPATPLEKYAAAFLDSVVVFPIAATLASVAMSALLALIGRAAGGPEGAIFIPLDAEALKAWAYYAIAAAVFLAGSASFRKIPVLKTIGVASVIGLVAAGLLMAIAWALFGGKNGAVMHAGIHFVGELNFDGSMVSERAQSAVRFLFDIACYAILPAFAILFGAAKVVEKEGRDEVQ
jgi:hypothetical protein